MIAFVVVDPTEGSLGFADLWFDVFSYILEKF